MQIVAERKLSFTTTNSESITACQKIPPKTCFTAFKTLVINSSCWSQVFKITRPVFRGQGKRDWKKESEQLIP